jgi:hypothetical protein
MNFFGNVLEKILNQYTEQTISSTAAGIKKAF